LGKAGSHESPPVFCEWRWYYHLPSLALWGLIALALIVPKENRHPQAWLILIPIFLVMMLWQMPLRLFPLSPSTANPSGFRVNSLAMAWAVVWLLGHRLRSRRPRATFWRMFIAMMVVGVLAYVGEYGTEPTSNMLVLLIPYGVLALALLLPMALARLCCRKRDRPGPFMAWLFLWMAFVPGAGMLLCVTIMAIAQPPELGMFLPVIFLVQAAIMALFLTVILYLFNLPFMLLAFKSPFYRERFQITFGLEAKSGQSPFGEPVPVTPATTEESVIKVGATRRSGNTRHLKTPVADDPGA